MMKSYFTTPTYRVANAHRNAGNMQVSNPMLGHNPLSLKSWAGFVTLFLLLAYNGNAQTYTMGTAPATNGATITNVCSGVFYDSGGSAGNYSNNENTTVTFTSSGGPLILTMEVAGTTFPGDNLFIHNGTSTAAPQFANSPFAFAGAPWVYVALGGSITVHFTSDAASVGAGWQMRFYCPTPTTINACTGSFNDPGGAANYAVNTYQTTTINSTGGTLSVAFSSLSLEPNYDFLYIFNGSSTSAAQVAGSPFTGTTSPGTITASGTSLTFLFVSDHTGVASGWTSTISCACPSPNCGTVNLVKNP